MKNILHIIVCFFVLLITTTELFAQEILVEKTDTSKVQGSKVVAIPFSFYLKTLGVSAAVDIAARGLLQQQSTSTLVGLVSTNGSKYIYWEAENFQVPMIKRLFFSPNINIAHYGSLDVYNGLNFKFPTETAGNNYSDKMNYYRIQSNKIEGEFIFRFLLPTGYGKNHVLDSLFLKNGLPINNGTSLGTLNPFTSGRTFIESSLFFQN
ncbi:MAG: hypothetical protein Q8862_14190, partial [Bacteroidota bacterium]|nr:hypothetical protein [Bacteroidota bacterium]